MIKRVSNIASISFFKCSRVHYHATFCLTTILNCTSLSLISDITEDMSQALFLNLIQNDFFAGKDKVQAFASITWNCKCKINYFISILSALALIFNQ